MKKFIFKLSFFVIPFFLLFLSGVFFTSKDKGDLLRVGNLIDFTSDYRTRFEDPFSKSILYTNLSEISAEERNEFTLLTIGDSFSQQRGVGYQNYLAQNSGMKILHFDKSCNPIQSLYEILNGDILDKIKVKYVLLQSVERAIVVRKDMLTKSKKITLESFQQPFKEVPAISTKFDPLKAMPGFFSSSVLKFPLYNILYQLDDNAYFSDTYSTKMNDLKFSYPDSNLLFYYEDLKSLSMNNSLEEVKKMNNELNYLAIKLQEKNIKLILLPCPDKFNAYYDFIRDKNKYLRPVFFENMEKLDKRYIYVDTKKIIDLAMKTDKDVYFYDDTHWTPNTSKLIAKGIENKIFK